MNRSPSMMRMRPRNIRFGNGLDCKKMTIEDENEEKNNIINIVINKVD